MSATRPLLQPPVSYRLGQLLRQAPAFQLWKAQKGTKPVLLYLIKFGEPLLMEPTFLLPRLEMQRQEFGLDSFLAQEEMGPADGGYFISEAWSDSSGTLQLSALKPVLRQLAKLHQKQRWHGGLSKAHFYAGNEGLKLAGFSFCAWRSTLTAEQQKQLIPKEELSWVAPELLEKGAGGASAMVDSYSLAKLLSSAFSQDQLNPQVQNWIEKAQAKLAKQRPGLEELISAL